MLGSEHLGGAGRGEGQGVLVRVATHLREYRPFEEAREWAQGLGLKSMTEWREFTKSGNLPPDIPSASHRVYRDEGWAGIRDWLGTEQPAGRKKRLS